MGTWVRLVRADSPLEATKVEYALLKDPVYSEKDIVLMLQCDVEIKQLPSDDLLFVRTDYKDYEKLSPNVFASTLLNEPVYGDAVVLSPLEFD